LLCRFFNLFTKTVACFWSTLDVPYYAEISNFCPKSFKICSLVKSPLQRYNNRQGWQNWVGRMSLGTPDFFCGVLTPHLNFEFCLNTVSLSNTTGIGSIVKVNRLMKKTFHSYFEVHLCPPPLKKVPPPLTTGTCELYLSKRILARQ